MQTNLYDLRKNKFKMTQEDIASYLGIAVVTYREKELGRVSFNQDEIFALAKLFQCPIEEIFLPRKAPKRLKYL